MAPRFILGPIPGGVVALGFVSLCMDLSSEMIHSLLPVFMVSVLGAGALAVGVVEGVAEATAAVTKLFSGVLSDWIGRRKPLILAGYGLAALTKPLFPLATSVPTVLLARFLDRIGKGIRGAPRDAIVADLTPEHLRGAAYGLRQSMDTAGAFAGPLLAMAVMAASGGDYRLVFWIATVPAVAAVALILFAVHEPVVPKPVVGGPAERRRFPIRRAELRRLGGVYWLVVAVASALTLARFSEAFLLLRAQDTGLPDPLVPLVLVVMNLVYAASAYPLGHLSDRLGHRGLLVGGILLLIAADAVLAAAGTPGLALCGAALWGLHMGATQGLLSALVAGAVPADLRGTAFGLYNLAGGATLFLASAAAGLLWQAVGPAATFLAGGAFAALSLAGFLALDRAGGGRMRGR